MPWRPSSPWAWLAPTTAGCFRQPDYLRAAWLQPKCMFHHSDTATEGAVLSILPQQVCYSPATYTMMIRFMVSCLLDGERHRSITSSTSLLAWPLAIIILPVALSVCTCGRTVQSRPLRAIATSNIIIITAPLPAPRQISRKV